ncbi:hypothetical protein ACIRF9_44585, partial [Streptomyces sp. NPDC096132]
NIEAILILIVLISVIPIVIEFLRARSQAKKNPQHQQPAAPEQQQPHQPQYPVMDDATTQLRRIDDQQPQQHDYYAQPQQQPQPYANDYYGGRQQYPQQQYPYNQNQGY